MAVDAYGVTWRLQVWPQPGMLAKEQSALPQVVLGTGFVMAVLLTCMVTDLIARKEAETALRKAHMELEQRVRERTAELAQVNKDLRFEILERKWTERALARQAQELARSNSELEQFAHVASHDLQEPLRKILAFGDRLKTSCSQGLGDQGHDYVERMQVAAARMQTLITDLLMLSRVTTQPQPFVSVDLTKIMRETVSDMEVCIQEVGGKVHLDPLPTIEADPVQMRQLLQNLIGNALKFHRNGEPPVVQVHAVLLQDQDEAEEADTTKDAPNHPCCEIRVEDNGIGFDEKYLDRIFTPFQRLHGRSEYQGTGMGLAICRKIVERHRGQITARSRPGQGAIFSVTLPIRQPQGGNRDGSKENIHHNPGR
jgi:signal transduction histidine kinase